MNRFGATAAARVRPASDVTGWRRPRWEISPVRPMDILRKKVLYLIFKKYLKFIIFLTKATLRLFFQKCLNFTPRMSPISNSQRFFFASSLKTVRQSRVCGWRQLNLIAAWQSHPSGYTLLLYCMQKKCLWMNFNCRRLFCSKFPGFRSVRWANSITVGNTTNKECPEKKRNILQ